MRHLHRVLESRAATAARNFPIVLTGPRRSGKAFLLRRLLPKANHYLFEDLDVVGRFQHGPPGFLDGKRRIKSPKVYIADPGPACHWPGIKLLNPARHA